MVNDIKKFCETNDGSNLISQADYVADAQRLIGNQPGIARSALVNKVLRQSSYMSNALAEYLATKTGSDVLDNNDTTALLALFNTAFDVGLPAGLIVTSPMVLANPSGYLYCNGAEVSRATYPKLFKALVTDQAHTPVTVTLNITGGPVQVIKTAHGLKGGELLRMRTTGTWPAGMEDLELIDVIAYPSDANTIFIGLQAGIDGDYSPSDPVYAYDPGQPGSGTFTFEISYFGLGNGTTTFNLPDFRGVSPRGWDDGRGFDLGGYPYNTYGVSGRAFGSYQQDGIQNHVHPVNVNTVATAVGNGAYSTSNAASNVQDKVDTNLQSQFLASMGSMRQVRQQDESRIKNIAMKFLIKY